ncbi:MAG: peptidoglycan DD-metalloendopeptidase family protein [Stagnimonas sp.]|nr:peptidoglycan DD-metalloendopeptidase family protein [Stagnimonas sp.]
MLAATLALATPVSAAPRDDGKSSPAQQSSQKELARVRARMEAIGRALDKDRGQRDALDSQIESAEKNLARSQAELTRLSAELAEQQAALNRAETARDAASQRLGGERAALALQLRAAFVSGQRDQLKLLLSQDSALPLGRLLTYHDYLGRARADRVRGIQTDLRTLQDSEVRIKTETAALAATRQQHELALREELRLKHEREKLLVRLNERIDDEEDQLKRLQKSEQDLVKLLDSIRDVMADTPVLTPKAPESDGRPARPFGQGRGKMGWPLRGGLLANYGDPKVGGKLSWKGLWIAADRGAPVAASARGRVAYVGYMHRYGLIVILEHEENHFTLYGHLDSAAVRAGDSLPAGTTLGAVGDSGGHDRTGLYFEVRKGTEPLDPRQWLSP